MGIQVPKLLFRVIRAIILLKEQIGSTVSSIVTHVRNALNEVDDAPRNIRMQVRRALRYAVDNGLVVQRAGKYQMVVPVDSLEMTVHFEMKKRHKKRTTKKKPCNKKKVAKNACKRRKSHHDYAKKGLKSQHRRRGKNKSHAKTPQSQKREGSMSNARSQSSIQQQQQQLQQEQQQQQQDVTPSANDTNRKSMESCSKSPSPARKTSNDGQHRETPFPEFCSDGSGSFPVRKKKGRRFCRAPIPPPNANQNPNVSPTVDEEPMDSSAGRTGSIPRNESPRRSSDLRQQDDTNEHDSLQK